LCEDDLAKRQEYEKDCSHYEVVREIIPDIVVTRARYTAPFPVTAREIVAIRVRRKLPDGGYLSYGKSINLDECLTDSSHVRAALHLIGAFCRPIPGEPNRCILTRIAQLDPKGNIPTMVVNAVKTKSGTSMILLRKVIRKRDFPMIEEADEDEDEEEPRSVGGQGNLAVNKKEDHQPSSNRTSSKIEAQSSFTAKSHDEDKGKERGRETSVVVEGDEIFFEAASALPWDERPFKEMYGHHRDEINKIVSSLQESINRVEQLSLASERRLRSLERLCADLRTQVGSGSSQRAGANLSWNTAALLALWPVVALSIYHVISPRSRPPKK